MSGWKDIFKETLRCTQCNLCILGCPMFMGTRYDHYSPRAIILLTRESYLRGGEIPKFLKDLIFICNLCGNCDVRCPAKIRITEVVKILRSYVLGNT